LETEYDITTEPAEMPLTTPPDTDAIASSLLLHDPPSTELPRLIVALTHTVDAPVMVPADGTSITVTMAVAVAEPQLPDTE
jgi:hypothetical protein